MGVAINQMPGYPGQPGALGTVTGGEYCHAIQNQAGVWTDVALPLNLMPTALINVQKFFATAVYTPTAGTRQVMVLVQGPGGGSAGTTATGAAQSSCVGGGGAGAYAEALIRSAFSGVTVTVPGGGAGGAIGVAGSNGTPASFGTLISCPGGLGSAIAAASSAVSVVLGGAVSTGPSFTGAGTLAIVSMTGAPALYGMVLVPGTLAIGGNGANSRLGNGGMARTGASFSASGFGAGAGGGATSAASSAGVAGANGGAGLVLVYEYE